VSPADKLLGTLPINIELIEHTMFLRYTKVTNLGTSFGVNEDIGTLDVAMNDTPD
jgi:hypothetical protein